MSSNDKKDKLGDRYAAASGDPKDSWVLRSAQGPKTQDSPKQSLRKYLAKDIDLLDELIEEYGVDTSGPPGMRINRLMSEVGVEPLSQAIQASQPQTQAKHTPESQPKPQVDPLKKTQVETQSKTPHKAIVNDKVEAIDNNQQESQRKDQRKNQVKAKDKTHDEDQAKTSFKSQEETRKKERDAIVNRVLKKWTEQANGKVDTDYIGYTFHLTKPQVKAWGDLKQQTGLPLWALANMAADIYLTLKEQDLLPSIHATQPVLPKQQAPLLSRIGGHRRLTFDEIYIDRNYPIEPTLVEQIRSLAHRTDKSQSAIESEAVELLLMIANEEL